MNYVVLNSRLLPEAEALVSVHDRGFRYGDGVFETIAVHAGVPCRFEWHIERLNAGLRAVKIDFNTGNVREQTKLLLKQNRVRDGILRIQITRGIGSRGYLPDPQHGLAGATVVIETTPLPAVPDSPVSLWQSSYAKISPAALPVQYKLCQGLSSTLARMEATQHGCFDALLLSDAGQLCETSSGNIFWLHENVLYTPSLACGVLEGATRAAMLRLSPYPAREVRAGMEALLSAEAVFITNVVWQSLAVNCLLPQGTRWDNDECARQFHHLLTQDREAYSRSHGAQWQ